jgi:hypothetical protein
MTKRSSEVPFYYDPKTDTLEIWHPRYGGRSASETSVLEGNTAFSVRATGRHVRSIEIRNASQQIPHLARTTRIPELQELSKTLPRR